MRQLKALIKQRGYRKDFVKMCERHSATGKQYFETIFWSHMLFNSGLSITPAKNLTTNIGATENSTHFSDLKTLPRRMRRQMTLPANELSFPLIHPKYVIEEAGYWKRKYKANAWNSPLLKIGQSFEALFLNLRYGNFKTIFKLLKARIKKIFNH